MEYIDIFTRDGQYTGVTRPKHDPKKRGEYYRHVLVIMKTTDSPAETGAYEPLKATVPDSGCAGPSPGAGAFRACAVQMPQDCPMSRCAQADGSCFLSVSPLTRMAIWIITDR